jgi:tartrate dehydratase beta subunit/fumarate hydratase class I family protein
MVPGMATTAEQFRAAAPTASGTMKSFTEYLTFNIPSKMAFVNITPQVEEAVRKTGLTHTFRIGD